MFFMDSEESIRAHFSDEERNFAAGAVKHCRNQLTGREIEICERIASTSQDDFDPFDLSTDDMRWFASLQTQFARQFARWMNEEVKA